MIDESLFQRIADEIAHEYQMGGLDGLYTDYARDILIRYMDRRFSAPAPEPEVAKSQQWLADRLSEAENSKDEEWLGEKNFGPSVVHTAFELYYNKGHKDPDGDDDVRGLA
jgi:hypothetical protein